MEVLIFLVLVCVVSMIVTWINLFQIKDLKRENQWIKNRLAKFLASPEQHELMDLEGEAKETYDDQVPPKKIVVSSSIPKMKSTEKVKPKMNFEQRFGARLPVWIGGIALAMAGVFMVKYSVDSGFLTGKVRVFLSGLFGGFLLYSARLISSKDNIANGNKISQALVGAAIVDLYICLYTAANLYHLITPLFGFIGMAIITAMAIILSLKYGPAIAIFGLVGGFITPTLVSSIELNALGFFAYLYFTFVGIFIVIRRQKWWLMSIPLISLPLLLVAIWLANNFTSADTAFLGLFLVAICVTAVFISKDAIENNEMDKSHKIKLSSILNYSTIGGSTLLMAMAASKANFGLMEWGSFGLLALGSIILSYFRQVIYGFAPFLTAAFSAVLLLIWHSSQPVDVAIVTTSFTVLYIVSGYLFMWQSANPKLWAILIGVTSVGYYLVGYYILHSEMQKYFISFDSRFIWITIALFLSLFAAQIIQKINIVFAAGGIIRHELLAIFAVTSTAFLSIAFIIGLEREFLPIAFALQILAIAWINNRVEIKALEKIAYVLGAIFVLLLIPQVVIILELALASLVGEVPGSSLVIMTIKQPLIYLGIPAIAFFGARLFFIRKSEGLVKFFDIVAVSLFTMTLYYVIRNMFGDNTNILTTKAGFAERGVITNALFLFGILCLWLAKKLNQKTLLLSGFTLIIISTFRIFYFDLVIYNPLLSHKMVGSMPILNALILPYGLPILTLFFINRDLVSLKNKFYLRFRNATTLLLLFTFISLNVRQLYHGTYLYLGQVTTNAETYTYSVVWLLLGAVLLFLGTIRKDKLIRKSSLALIILTVGKVFFYDASELTGLYRVFSFLGLGISLIALSWFYTRFISDDEMQKQSS